MHRTPTTPARRSGVRPEIQALRAIAVCAVVLHHGWPAVAPAGFMGVDVFFVVSGFLITALLMREAEASGRISLGRFYLRRARRILPAATVVLAVVTVLTVLLVPLRLWASWLREVVASALYVENWLMVADSQNPLRDDLRSTPVQHFWSLSVEEQFYLLWPLLLLLALWFAARRSGRMRLADGERVGAAAGGAPTGAGPVDGGAASAPAVGDVLGRAGRWIPAIVLAAVTLASFVLNLVLTALDHNLSYFSTFARAWEFGLGGLLAILAAQPLAGRDRLRAAVSWVGLAMIAIPIVTFHDDAAFPGWPATVPALGAAAVIWAGMPRVAWSPGRIAGIRPVQWLGDASYSLYLWHWPIFLFVPYLTGVPSPPWLMVLLVFASIAVAGLSKRYIEDPFRRPGTRVAAHPAAFVGGIAAAIALVVAAGIAAPAIAEDAATTSACPVVEVG